ncbi:MAG: hypothetical protein MUP21_03750 [Dehalococcoidia bacterium]|nr:hypothetical protein [Dehalococcoidia bacterium]
MKAMILKGTSPIECDFCVKGYENCESIRAWIGCPTSGNLPSQMPFVVSPSAQLRTGLSNHERPFDRLRANGRKPIFGTNVAKAIQRGIGRL